MLLRTFAKYQFSQRLKRLLFLWKVHRTGTICYVPLSLCCLNRSYNSKLI